MVPSRVAPICTVAPYNLGVLGFRAGDNAYVLFMLSLGGSVLFLWVEVIHCRGPNISMLYSSTVITPIFGRGEWLFCVINLWGLLFAVWGESGLGSCVEAGVF